MDASDASKPAVTSSLLVNSLREGISSPSQPDRSKPVKAPFAGAFKDGSLRSLL